MPRPNDRPSHLRSILLAIGCLLLGVGSGYLCMFLPMPVGSVFSAACAGLGIFGAIQVFQRAENESAPRRHRDPQSLVS